MLLHSRAGDVVLHNRVLRPLAGLVSRTEAKAGATWKLAGFTVSEP